MDLAQRSVLVLGLGESGLAMARWCRREGARVRVADTRESPPQLAALRADDAAMEFFGGPFEAALLDGVDTIAISPGLSPHVEPQRTLLAAASAANIEVVGEIELFARKLAALREGDGYAPNIVAITGTNGKTTVTRLVGKLCEAAGRSVGVAGNISPAALDALADALDRDALPSTWVLELSSFQLETTTSLSPDAATVLNVTQDHLDWHGGIDAYADAKAAIFAARTVRVLNRDDARVLAMRTDDTPSVTFGLDAPVVAGSFGMTRESAEPDAASDPLRWLALAEGDDPDAEARGSASVKPAKRKGAKTPVVAPPLAEPALVKRLMPVDALRLRGDHNVANVLAALALGRAIGLPMAAMLRAAAAYRGEPHRVELVLSAHGVDYIDDSKGTNVGATVAALEGLGQPVVLIAGGDGKGQDFSPLAAPVARHARAVLLIGKDKGAIRDAIGAALSRTDVTLIDCATLDDAVLEASRIATAGDAVLLSPACASLDMFRDYKHRADVFVAAARRVTSVKPVACEEPAPC